MSQEKENRQHENAQSVQEGQQPHKRRVRYKGRYPKKFEEKYKELQPEKYQDTIPVSYTHLDVYKRQGLHRLQH